MSSFIIEGSMKVDDSSDDDYTDNDNEDLENHYDSLNNLTAINQQVHIKVDDEDDEILEVFTDNCSCSSTVSVHKSIAMERTLQKKTSLIEAMALSVEKVEADLQDSFGFDVKESSILSSKVDTTQNHNMNNPDLQSSSSSSLTMFDASSTFGRFLCDSLIDECIIIQYAMKIYHTMSLN